MLALGRGRHQGLEVVEVAQVGMDGVVAALGPSRWPTGCPDRRARPPRRCPDPCGARCRWDGWGAGRPRRSRGRPARRARAATARQGRAGGAVGTDGSAASGGTARTRWRTGPARAPRRPRTVSEVVGVAGPEAAGGLAQVVIGLVHAGGHLAGQRVAPGGQVVDPGPDPEAVRPRRPRARTWPPSGRGPGWSADIGTSTQRRPRVGGATAPPAAGRGRRRTPWRPR